MSPRDFDRDFDLEGQVNTYIYIYKITVNDICNIYPLHVVLNSMSIFSRGVFSNFTVPRNL